MKAAFLLVFVFVLMSFASPGLAQSERLSESEYNTALGRALESASSRDRRVSTVETFYTGTQVTGTRKLVSDFAGPDAKRIQVTEDFNGRGTISDSVRVGSDYFCREGGKAWRPSKKDCSKLGMLAMPDGNYEYSVEPDPNNYGRKIYTRRATFTDSGSPERDAVRLKFIEIKFVTDETGIVTEYTETRRGGIEPNGWSSTQMTRYEYEPRDLRITDPTKSH